MKTYVNSQKFQGHSNVSLCARTVT